MALGFGYMQPEFSPCFKGMQSALADLITGNEMNKILNVVLALCMLHFSSAYSADNFDPTEQAMLTWIDQNSDEAIDLRLGGRSVLNYSRLIGSGLLK